MTTKSTALLLALALMVLSLLTFIYVPWRPLIIKANQYVEMNLAKNWGVRLTALEVTQWFLASLPKPRLLQFDRIANDIGFSPTSLLSLQNIPLDKRINVESASSLRLAMQQATAGDWIVVQPGSYTIDKRLTVKNSGTQQNPIHLIAQTPGQTFLQIDTQQGLYIDKSHWLVEGFVFTGICASHQVCEHAIHVYGDADQLRITNNQFVDFNAAIKANGNYSTQPAKFADQVTIRGNDFYNTSIRKTTTPSSPIDVVGGNDWRIINNFIADFSRQVSGGISVTYGAFLKGGGENGLLADNVINCAWKLPYQSSLDVRVGLSLGNGGTERKFCQSAACQYEHRGGEISSNLILNCINDVSIYLNKATATRVSSNILLNSLGIDGRFPETSVSISNNKINGEIRARDGAFINTRDNDMVH